MITAWENRWYQRPLVDANPGKVSERAQNALRRAEAMSPDDYRAALVGAPNRKYLWILAREPRLDDSEYARLVDIAKAQGFDVSALKRQ